MADDVTPGELGRRIDALAAEFRDAAKSQDDRLTRLATDCVPGTVFAAERERVNAQFSARVKESDERWGLLREDIAEVKRALDRATQKQIDNRFAVRMTIVSGFLLPVSILLLQRFGWI